MPYDDRRFARNNEDIYNHYPLNESTDEIINRISTSNRNKNNNSRRKSESKKELKFCPQCGGMMLPSDGSIRCNMCGYEKESSSTGSTYSHSSTISKSSYNNSYRHQSREYTYKPKVSVINQPSNKTSQNKKNNKTKKEEHTSYKPCPECNTLMNLTSYMGYPKCPSCGHIDSPHIVRSTNSAKKSKSVHSTSSINKSKPKISTYNKPSNKTSQNKKNKKAKKDKYGAYKPCPECKEPMSLISPQGYPKCSLCGYVDTTKLIKSKSSPKIQKAKKDEHTSYKYCPNCYTLMNLTSYMGYPKCPSCGYIDNPNIVRSTNSTKKSKSIHSTSSTKKSKSIHSTSSTKKSKHNDYASKSKDIRKSDDGNMGLLICCLVIILLGVIFILTSF